MSIIHEILKKMNVYDDFQIILIFKTNKYILKDSSQISGVLIVKKNNSKINWGKSKI